MSLALPRYPNQQLKSVSVEAYFSGRFRLIQAMPEIQEAFGNRLHDVWVPVAREGEPLALTPFQLRDGERTRALAVALNQATYMALAYPGHAAFLPEAVAALSEVLGLGGVESLNRVAYRYENEVRVGLEDGKLPLHRIIDLGSFPEWCGQKSFLDFGLMWGWPTPDGSVHVEVKVGRSPDSHATSLLRISIVAQVEPAGPSRELEAFAKKAHERAYGCFEAMITEEFRNELRKEPDTE